MEKPDIRDMQIGPDGNEGVYRRYIEDLEQYYQSKIRLLKQEHNDELYEKAPIIVYQKINIRFRDLAVKNKNVFWRQIPEMVELMNAATLLERLYPEINEFFGRNKEEEE